ncbi:cytochrome P450 [Streptomyces lydicus]
MRRLQPRIAQIVAEHLDAMAAHGGPVDLVQSFALPVPSLVICELLGVPYADRAEFQQWGAAQLDRSLSHVERAAAGAESRWYMAELVRRQRVDPGEDLLGMLVRRHGAALSDADLIGIGALLLLAGHETTASMLALSTLLLLEHPDQWTLLRDDPASTDRAVEELLRYLSIVHHPGMRTALRDTVIGDQPIAAGDMVLCSIPGANRAPARGPDGDTFDIFRKPSGHLAFGHGIHHCVGAPLARLELRIALPELARRFPALRLAVAPDELVFRADSIVYGVQSLPVRW